MKNVLRNSDLKMSSIMLFKKVILSALLFFVIAPIGIQAQTVTDIDGNVYNTITIGSQVWMAENLKTTKYNDGTTIPNITDNTAWTALDTGAYCDYNNTPSNSTIYGRLYNWYTVDNNAATKVASNGGKNVCPTSWHVPTDPELTTLTTYLGGEDVAGGKLKETGLTDWITPNTGATNETGFTALPSGTRSIYGSYYYIGYYGYCWSSTEFSATQAYNRMMYYIYTKVGRYYEDKYYGFSIRCLKDLSTDITNPTTSIVEIYPNPVSGILTIDFKNEDFKSVRILNSQGILLIKEKAISPIQHLDFSKFGTGLYFLELANPIGEVKCLKIIKR